MARDFGYFSLSGDFNPDEITRQLGIEPSWFQRIGDPGPPGALGSRKGAVWCLACDDDDFGDVGDQIISLVVRLMDKSEIVSDLSTRFFGTFNLVAYLNGNYPGFFLMARIVRDLASLNVDVDCRFIYASDEPIQDGKNAD